MRMRDTSQPSRGLMFGGVAAAAVLAVLAGGGFVLATLKNQSSQETTAGTEVQLTATSCDPAEISVKAGANRFDIINNSDRPVEWEILDGVMVVAERENILPGIRQTVSANLAPGDYAITCGLISNPRGSLHVLPSQDYAAASAKLSLRDYLGPLSEYKVYLTLESKAAVDAAKALAEAIHAGNLDQARQLYQQARTPFKHIEPVAYRMSDLEHAIDATADYLEKREDDPEFSGFHRIEYGLFDQSSLDGLAPIADRLVADMTLLSARMKALTLNPSMLIALPGDMADHLLQGRIEKGENHYAHTDLADLDASLAGIEKLAGLLQAVASGVDPKLADEIQSSVTGARSTLEGLKIGNDYPAYDQIDKPDRDRIANAFRNLADVFSKLGSQIGVSA